VPIGLRWAAKVDATYDAFGPGVLQAVSRAVSDPLFPGYFTVGQPVYLARIVEAAMMAQGVVNLTINAAAGGIPASSVPAALNTVVPITPRQLPKLQAGLFTVDPWVDP
jgi:hypothetical protein